MQSKACLHFVALLFSQENIISLVIVLETWGGTWCSQNNLISWDETEWRDMGTDLGGGFFGRPQVCSGFVRALAQQGLSSMSVARGLSKASDC